MVDLQALDAARIGIAVLIGLATGLERQWSGHATGPDARFAGLRTFSLLGALGGIAGVLTQASYVMLAAVLALGGVALCVGGYVVATRRPTATTDGTTEAAALTVIALGILAGLGWLGLAAGGGAILVLVLREKERLHWMVQRVNEREIRAGVQFAVLAIVVLPLLPKGPYFGVVALEPLSLSGRRAHRYEAAILDLVEAGVLQHRVGDKFDGVVVDVDDRDETRGVVTVQEPAVEAPVVGPGRLPLGTGVQVELTRADVEARKVEFTLR